MCLGQLKKLYSLYVDITLDKSEKAHVLAKFEYLWRYILWSKTWGKQEQENKGLVIRYLGTKKRIVALLTIFFEIY